MGPFSSTHFILKTGISAGSRPTTSRNVRVPFSLLSQSLQCFRAAGFGVEAINVDPTAPQVTRTSPEAKSATKAAPRKKLPLHEHPNLVVGVVAEKHLEARRFLSVSF